MAWSSQAYQKIIPLVQMLLRMTDTHMGTLIK